MSRGFASAARRVSLSVLMVACFISMLTWSWASRTGSPSSALPVLGPSARASLSGSRAVTPGLVNLTFSPASEQAPAWSPNGQLIAFTSDGIDTNNDGRIDAVGATRALYTMNADGGNLIRYPLDAGSVTGLAWDSTGATIDLAVNTGGVYTIQRMTLATKTAAVIYTGTGAINGLYETGSGNGILFDMVSPDGRTDIYLLPLAPANAAVQPLTARNGNNRGPVISSDGTEIIFSSDRGGRSRIYRMGLDGSNQRQLTTSNAAGDDSQARPTANGRLVFASTRPTVAGDTRTDFNVWVMPYGQEGANVTPVARFFSDPSDTSDQTLPAPRPTLAQADQVLFVSNIDGNDEIYLGQLTDNEAPYITQPATATPKNAAPGGVVTISVPVVDTGTGVRNVWLQIKDPDPAVLDARGQNHVLTNRVMDWRVAAPNVQDVPTDVPVEFGPYNPVTNTYLDIAQATSHPGYYARAGAVRLFADEGQGYPEVPIHWVQMYDDATHGDTVAGDGVYTCQWTTSATPSDWYFDIIVEDNTAVAQDSLRRWHGNRRRFDNVGGCSTVTFLGGKRILFVDDYVDGQRFLSMGLPPVTTNYDSPAFPNSLYYFTGAFTTPEKLSPFVPGAEFGGADVWRLLARGPVPQDILNRYLPTSVTQVSPTDSKSTVTIKHGDKLVVWVSPSSWYHLISPTVGGSGSLIETSAQDALTQFVNAGGRLFVIGSDLASGLTAGNTKVNNFLANVLGAKQTKVSQVLPAVAPQYNVDLPQSFLLNETPTSSWYGLSLPAPRWTAGPVRGSLLRNSNPSQFVTYALATGLGTDSVWDTLNNQIDSKSGIYAGVAADVVSTFKTFASGGRVVFWSFGFEHLSADQRSAPALDTLEWLQDGSVSGTVVRLNDLAPIANALVTVNEVTVLGPNQVKLKAIAAAHTDALGRYAVFGIAPGKQYRVLITANGYFGTLFNDVDIAGGKNTNSNLTNFFLNRDTNPAILWGMVTQNNVPVVDATVTATPVGGAVSSTTTTDATGRYEFTTLASGPYTVSVTQPTTNQTANAVPNPTLSAGETLRADINFSVAAANPSTLSATVTGSGTPIPGATAVLRLGVDIVTTLTTDLNGFVAFPNLVSGTYTLSVSAPGYLTWTRAVVFDQNTGATVAPDLTPVANDNTQATVTGRVYEAATGAALGGVTVDLLVGDTVKATQTTAASFTTDTSTYNFSFTVASGAYQLRISKTGFRTQTLNVDLAPGATLSNLEFRLEPLLTLNPGISLFALPGDYSAQPTTAIFGLTPADSGQLANRLATYDTMNRTYLFYTGVNLQPILPGRAYWSRLDTALTVSLEGLPIDTSQPYQVQLQPGWNLVGNPFPFTIDLYECGLLLDAAPQMSWTDAVAGNKAGNAIYAWNGRDYVPSTMLQPYKGYWLFIGAQNGNIRLAITNRSAVRASGPARARRAPTSDAWQVRLEARVGDCRDGANYFGVAADGQDGFNNRLDAREPPQPPAGYVSLAFPHRAWGADSGDFSTDIQAPGSGVKRWQFRVVTNQANADVTIAWPELTAQLPAGLQAELRDLQTQQTCYLNTTGQYVFHAGDGGATRDFEVVVSPHAAGLLVADVRGTSAAGGRAETLVSFSLAEPARVEVNIRSATGRLVRTLATNLAADAGLNTLTWDRLDTAGRSMPRGNYLVEVHATTGSGRQARGVGLISLVTLR